MSSARHKPSGNRIGSVFKTNSSSMTGRAGAPFVSLVVALLILSPASIYAKPNPVADWNALLTTSIARECQTPALASRNLATFHLAIASAVESCQGRSEEDKALAGASAASAVGKMLFSGEAARFDTLLPIASSHSDREDLIKIGHRAAAAAIEMGRGDAETTTVNYHTSFEPGQWERTCNRPPELPHWRWVRPFLIGNAKEFLPAPPPALDSPEYAKAVREVQTYGAKESIARSKEQTMLAKFWSDFSYTSTPPGHWNEVARFLARERGMEIAESSRLFAALNVAMADVSIVCWEAKYHYNFWRPLTAIHGADRDGNPETHAYAEWKPLLRTPPHPDYVSGHAAFSGAAARVMKEFFGDGTEFRVTSETVPDVERTYTSFEGCAKEIAESRVFGGIHYRFSGEVGLAMGRAVADSVLQSLGSRQISQILYNQEPIP